MRLLASGQAFLNSRLGTAAGIECVYTRGVNSVTLTVWLGSTDVGMDQVGLAARVESGTPDVLIPVSGLILAGEATEPKTNDRLQLTINGTLTDLEVLPVGDGPAWRFSDNTRTRFRVHTREVP